MQNSKVQTRQVIKNLEIVLNGVGPELSHAVQRRGDLTAFGRDCAAFNETCQSVYPADHRPARTTVGVTAFAVGALVENDCSARRSA